MSAKEDLKARFAAMSPEEKVACVERLKRAIFAPMDDEPDEDRMDIENMTDEEVTAHLVAQGVDIEDLHRRLHERLAEIRAKLDSQENIS